VGQLAGASTGRGDGSGQVAGGDHRLASSVLDHPVTRSHRELVATDSWWKGCQKAVDASADR